MNILIVKLSALGDVTHTLPALTALRRAYPDARIDWLIEEAAAPILTGHVALNHLLIWSRRRFTGSLRSGRWLTAARLLREFLRLLRDTRYDLIIDFQGLLKSSIWVFLSRSPRKVGFGPGLQHSEGSYLFLTERVPAVSMEIHALDRGLLLLEGIGIPPSPVVYDFPIPDSARVRVHQLLRDRGIQPHHQLVAIHPMTRWPTKLWLTDRFAAVAEALHHDGIQVVLTGAPQDRTVLDQVVGEAEHSLPRLDGLLDLQELAALYQRTQVVLSTDTGPMHIAAAVGTPVVALFGPTAANRTGPHGDQHTVLHASIGCRPCFSRRCRSSVAEPMACMRRLEVAPVVEAIRRTLAPGSPGATAPSQ